MENVGTFLECLRRSGLIPVDQLHMFLNVARGVLSESHLLPEADASPLAEYLVQSRVITKWQARRLMHRCSRGFFLGRFRLLELLGRGGMSVVYLADEPGREGCVALKVLLPDRSAHSSLSERFRLEADALCELSRIGHPNIVRAYSLEYGRQGGGPGGDSVTWRYEKQRHPGQTSDLPEGEKEDDPGRISSVEDSSSTNLHQTMDDSSSDMENSLEHLERITDQGSWPSVGTVLAMETGPGKDKSSKRSRSDRSNRTGEPGISDEQYESKEWTMESIGRPELVNARAETALLSGTDAQNPGTRSRIHTSDDGYWFLVLEYIRGRSLATIIREDGPLPIRTAVDYLRQAAEGLWAVHKAGYVHRDIKPGNLMVEYTGCVRLLDMGLARQGEETPDGLTPR
ncbi:MAG: protein kinase, partial [Planctomycetia bacterium]|nr:protein kinase [Planctomycetia bacterium]